MRRPNFRKLAKSLFAAVVKMRAAGVPAPRPEDETIGTRQVTREEKTAAVAALVLNALDQKAAAGQETPAPPAEAETTWTVRRPGQKQDKSGVADQLRNLFNPVI